MTYTAVADPGYDAGLAARFFPWGVTAGNELVVDLIDKKGNAMRTIIFNEERITVDDIGRDLLLVTTEAPNMDRSEITMSHGQALTLANKILDALRDIDFAGRSADVRVPEFKDLVEARGDDGEPF